MIRAKTSILLSLAAVMGLSACSDGQMFNENNPNRNTNQGVILGALGGAAAGRLIGGNNDDAVKNSLAGAAVGAIAGGVIGSQLDKQEAELRQQLGNNVSINNTGDRLIVTMPQDILFATDSSTLRADLTTDLRTVARSLNNYPDTTVQVIGHTDNTGDASIYGCREQGGRAAGRMPHDIDVLTTGDVHLVPEPIHYRHDITHP